MPRNPRTAYLIPNRRRKASRRYLPSWEFVANPPTVESLGGITTELWTDGGSYLRPTTIGRNVGIGADVADRTLHVTGLARISGSNPWLEMDDDDSDAWRIQNPNGNFTVAFSPDFSTWTERLRIIGANGAVQIKSDAVEQLRLNADAVAATPYLSIHDDNDDRCFRLQANVSYGRIYVDNGARLDIGTNTGGQEIRFYTDNDERFRIEADGDIFFFELTGLGEVALGVSDTGQLVTNPIHWLVNGNDIYTNPTGNVGIKTASPAETLHVVGSARVSDLAGSGTRMVTADADGTLGDQTIPGGGVTFLPGCSVLGESQWSDLTAAADTVAFNKGNTAVSFNFTIHQDMKGPDGTASAADASNIWNDLAVGQQVLLSILGEPEAYAWAEITGVTDNTTNFNIACTRLFGNLNSTRAPDGTDILIQFFPEDEVGTGGGSGISHAPSNGNYYASRNGSWQVIPETTEDSGTGTLTFKRGGIFTVGTATVDWVRVGNLVQWGCEVDIDDTGLGGATYGELTGVPGTAGYGSAVAHNGNNVAADDAFSMVSTGDGDYSCVRDQIGDDTFRIHGSYFID